MIPNVLLLGNGINLSYGGISWNGLLGSISTQSREYTNRIIDSDIPAPLKAIAVTEDRIDVQMKLNKNNFYGSVTDGEQQSILKRLLNMGFDCILTTNYSYELEEAGLGLQSIEDKQLKNLQTHTAEAKRAEAHFLLHTYMDVPAGSNRCPVWHIHGEARKPDSMILGHYYYGNLLFKIKELLGKRGDAYRDCEREGKPFPADSWVDYFITGNVYILGFGMDISELDLWWLMNRKKREKAQVGKVHFYEPRNDADFAKPELLRMLGAEIHSMGISKESKRYKEFYDLAIADIERRIR